MNPFILLLLPYLLALLLIVIAFIDEEVLHRGFLEYLNPIALTIMGGWTFVLLCLLIIAMFFEVSL